jgi:hypothetical protein
MIFSEGIWLRIETNLGLVLRGHIHIQIFGKKKYTLSGV